MTQPLASIEPGPILFRLGHGPDPWDWQSWAYAKPDGTFGNRWDDADGRFRVLYACTQRLGTFIECLARFRPDPAVLAGLAEIDDDHSDPLVPAPLMPGEVPKSWLSNRRIGMAAVDGNFAQIGHSQTLAWLNHRLATRLVHYHIPELDGSAIRLSVPRRFTQEISRVIYELTDAGRRQYDGIAYLSRLGDEFE